jgi:hypothetical protein
MVKTKFLLLLLVIGVSCFSFSSQVNAQREYYFGQEWAKIWINQDGAIDLFYNVSLTLDSGDNINWIYIGQPNDDFTIGQARDQYGNILQTSDISTSGDYKARVDLNSPLRAGETIWFTLTTNVAKMIFEDQTYPGNDGMQFTLSWFSEAIIVDSRITIVLPPQVSQSEVKTGDVLWSNTFQEEDRLAIYWEKQNSFPNERFNVAVSYPKQEGWSSYTQTSDGLLDLLGNFWNLFIFGGIILVLIIGVVLSKQKLTYSKPTVGIESLGILRGLTAVEASYLLDLKPPKIITEILYSLLKKRAIWIQSTKPSLKFSIQKQFQDKTGTRKNPLRYYEIDFLKAIKEEGTLDEKKLANTVMWLRSTVEKKLKGYCRKDTVEYYKKIVDKAWSQVQAAKTPQLASQAYDEQLLWLFLDPKLQDKTQTAFQNQNFNPNPLWFWYWYSTGPYQSKTPNKSITKPPTLTRKAPSIPGADFANNIATAVENSANNIVVSLEKFANSILPPPSKPKTSRQPTHNNVHCDCACAACACACACVSCACACAGGGVG